MATKTICDGCGGEVSGDVTRPGFILKVDYCDECAATAAEYGAEVDALHTDLAKRWETGLAKIRAKFAKKLLRLPDVTPQ